MFFAFPYALFPFVADAVARPVGAGTAVLASWVGSLVATATSGWTRHVHHHGRRDRVRRRGWGAGDRAVRPVADFRLVLCASSRVAGAADMVSGMFRTADVEPDDSRRDPRPHGRDRAALVLARTAARAGALEPRSRSGLSLRVSIVSGGCGLRRGCSRPRDRAARRCGVRRADRRERGTSNARCGLCEQPSTTTARVTRARSERHGACASRDVLTRSSSTCPARTPDPPPGGAHPACSQTGSTPSRRQLEVRA